MEKRGISKTTCQPFDQLKTNGHQAVFGLYTGFDTHMRLCSTINYYFDREGESRKYFQKDLPRVLAVLSPTTDVKQIVITESPIVAIQHRQGNSQAAHTLYLCTCGKLTKGIRNELSKVFVQAQAHGQSVSLMALEGRDLAQIKLLLTEKKGVQTVSPTPIKTMGIHTLLSKVAQTLGKLARIHAHGEHGESESEEEEIRKRKGKRRRM